MVVAVGYNPVEYDPWLWNVNEARQIINVDIVAAELDNAFVPAIELIGDIALTLEGLGGKAGGLARAPELEAVLEGYKKARSTALLTARSSSNSAVHPLQIVRELEQFVTPDMTLCLDMAHSISGWRVTCSPSVRVRCLSATASRPWVWACRGGLRPALLTHRKKLFQFLAMADS